METEKRKRRTGSLKCPTAYKQRSSPIINNAHTDFHFRSESISIYWLRALPGAPKQQKNKQQHQHGSLGRRGGGRGGGCISNKPHQSEMTSFSGGEPPPRPPLRTLKIYGRKIALTLWLLTKLSTPPAGVVLLVGPNGADFPNSYKAYGKMMNEHLG